MDPWPMFVSVLIVNLPFGYWRANVGRLSAQWLLAIHLPVALVVLLRLLSGMGWQLANFWALAAAFFVGQLLGMRLHRWREEGDGRRPTSCLVMDLVRGLRASR